MMRSRRACGAVVECGVVVEERRFKADGENENKKLQQLREFVNDSHLDMRGKLIAAQMLINGAIAAALRELGRQVWE
jgi:hypothetical protein